MVCKYIQCIYIIPVYKYPYLIIQTFHGMLTSVFLSQFRMVINNEI